MATATISIEVDAVAARAFASASAEDRQKLELLLSLRLQELTGKPARSLNEIMDEIGANAVAQGLTAHFLASIVNEEQTVDNVLP